MGTARTSTAVLGTALLAFALATARAGDPPTAAAPTEAVASAAPCCLLEAGKLINLEIAQPLNSWEFVRGDPFALRVAEPVLVDGQFLIPAGTPVQGEIVHAAAARGGGAPGELLIAARSLEVAGSRVRLRGLKLGRTGEDNAGLALGVSLAAGPFAMFIRGREIEIPAGTRVHARLAEPLQLAPGEAAPPATTIPPTPDTRPEPP